MSAFICNNLHVSILASFAAVHAVRGTNGASPKQIGLILHAENVKSVNARYNDNDFYSFRFMADIRGYDWVEPIQIIKAADCLSYQSCEHDGWETSKARVILDGIKSAALDMMGYGKAEWEICQPTHEIAA